MRPEEGSQPTPEVPQPQQAMGGKRDCRDLVFMDWLCVDFRERLLDALTTSRSSTFVKAKHLAKENILDILDCISSLSVSEDTKERETAGVPLNTPGSSLDTLPADSPPEYLGIHGESPPTEFFQHLNDIDLGSLGLSLSTSSTQSGATAEWPSLSPRVVMPGDLELLQTGGHVPYEGLEIVGADDMQWWSPQGGLDNTPARMSPKRLKVLPLWPGDQMQDQDHDQNQGPNAAVLDFMDLDLLAENGEICALTPSHGGSTTQANPKEGAALPAPSTLMGNNDMQLEKVREGLVAQRIQSPVPNQRLARTQDPKRRGTLSPTPDRAIRRITGPHRRATPSQAPTPPVSTQQFTSLRSRAQGSPACNSQPTGESSHNLPVLSPASVGSAQVVRAQSSPRRPRNEDDEEEPLAAEPPCNVAEEAEIEAIVPFVAGLSSLMGLDCTPVHLPSAGQVFAAFSHQLPENKRSVAQLLTCLFYAVGSPDSLSQLRHALQLARKTSVIPVVQSGLQNDLATTVQALDQLDSITTLSHILRRYYLVRLSAHRSRLEQDHIASKLACRGSKRMLKYDCARLQLVRDNGNGAVRSSDTSDRRVSKDRPKNRSKTQALTDLMQMLYPNLTPLSPGESRSTSDCMYTRKLTQLRNRLSCARNWYTFEHTFPGAILALIPCAGRYSISIDQ